MPASAIYEGWVRHRRNHPRTHQFNFRFFMLSLDLDELPRLKWGPFWSARRWAICRFDHREHLRHLLDEPTGGLESLKTRVIRTLREHGIEAPIGPVRLLTQLSFLGYSMNPVSFYYCYDPRGESIEAIIAEVNNTPWGEQHVYVISGSEFSAGQTVRSSEIAKDFHVSPFMTLDFNYRMAFSSPGKRLAVKIENHRRQGDADSGTDQPLGDPATSKVLDVTMDLRRRPWRVATLNWLLVKYPAISFQVVAGIYWHALRLYLKKIPFVPHPQRSRPTDAVAAGHAENAMHRADLS